MKNKEEINQITESKPPKKKKKKHRFLKGFLSGIIVSALITVVLPGVVGGIAGKTGNGRVLNQATLNKLTTLSRYIQSSYYEDVDTSSLQEGLYQGLFDNLDQYSRYYTAEEYKELYETSLSGSYCGIGASLQQDEKTKSVSIVHVYDGSPAKKAGLKKDDIIVKADKYEAADMDLNEFIKHIRGDEGSKVHLKVYRPELEDYLEVDVTRKKLDLPTVSHEMLEQKIGYIDVTEFTDKTAGQFESALSDLQKKGMKALIVDLRANPGGLVTSVCQMLDDILPKGLLVYTQDRNGKKQTYNSTDEKSLDVPLAVLVDSQSASASEIFAGAIQDRKAGTIIGTTTFGKGVVQTIRTMQDGSAFKLTTNRYYTPGGTCIQGIGITPDVKLEYEFLGKDGEAYSYEKDNQIQKALQVLKKKLGQK